MLKRILSLGFGFAFSVLGTVAYGQGATCAEMEPICTDDGVAFTATVGTTSEPGNDYGCLFTQPNPSWYYLEISVAGDIEFALEAPSDIDFIIWGPFDDLDDAISNCGTLGTTPESPEVDCSYSGAAYETPEITGASVGDVYILLITNYAAVVQDVTCDKIGGDAETDCGIIEEPPCDSYAGTFTIQKNGEFVPSDDPLYLCEGDEFEIVSNDDYTLPNDTIAAPIGDGIYTAQIMWLVYNAPPVSDDPIGDPGYMGLILPTEDLADIHDADSPIGGDLGCGTYYLVPVAGDDGVGDGGDNDNGSVTWDKNGNGCYELGTPIEITYACPIEAEISVNCGGPVTNGIDFDLTGGDGDYTVVNGGLGDLAATDVPNGGTATIANLENGWGYEITVTDEQGCQASFEGIFAAPVISPIVITPAVSCPDASEGNVDVTIVDGSGNGDPYGLSLNGTLTAGTTADFDGIAGTAVTIIATDSEGCITDSVVTITSAGHFIDVDIVSVTGVLCFGDANGTAEISATPVDEFGAEDGSIVSITWTSPGGTDYPVDETNTSQTDMEPGTWFVTILDDYGCEVTIPVEIETPAELDVYVNTFNNPTCYGFTDASIDLGVTGGTGDYTFSWADLPDEENDVLNTIGSGTYWGYAEDENGCIDSVMIIITDPDSLYAEFTIKDVFCFGDSTGAIIVDEVFNSVGEVSYNWNLGDLPNPPSDATIAGDLPAGTYLVTVQDDNCSNLYEFTLTQNPEIEFVELGYDPAYCRLYGYQVGHGRVFAAATGGAPDYDYLWTNLETEETNEFSTWGGLNPGNYQITVTDDLGCTKTEIVQVDSLNPIADFTVTSDQLNSDLMGTEPIDVVITNTSLYFSNELDPDTDTTFFIDLNHPSGWTITHDYYETFDTTYTGEAVYTVCLIAFNQNGCSDTLCRDITSFETPGFVPFNVFTPNGDGVNDVFSFDTGAKGVDEFSCVIVDRWGSTVFEFTDITQEWNGTRGGGQDCTAGVYFYTYSIKYTNSTTQSGQGHVTLSR